MKKYPPSGNSRVELVREKDAAARKMIKEDMMDFALNEEQLELQEMVREFVEKEITPYAAEMDEQNHWREGLMEKANEMGLLNVIVPEELDGPGLDSIAIATIYEELGKGCAGVATSLAANSLATVPVLLAAPMSKRKCTAMC